MTGAPLVTVIVPAYNAVATLDETLRSVRSQTHRNLEILVVDDGSTDGTVAIAERHAARDPRVRVISQRNGGVAAARNRGIAEAMADLVAPVDADDLWAPDKIARQLAALREGGERVALVYTWYARIDAESRVIALGDPHQSGDVLRSICFGNFVGNGSSTLMRKAAVLEAGGYDAGLRARAAQGCEDFKLYFRIAERHRFALVAEDLTGYRQTPTNMSSDGSQMFRSWLIVADEMRERHPEFSAETVAGGTWFSNWLLEQALRTRHLRGIRRMAPIVIRRSPVTALRTLVYLPLRYAAGRLRRSLFKRPGYWPTKGAHRIGERFVIGVPEEAREPARIE